MSCGARGAACFVAEARFAHSEGLSHVAFHRRRDSQDGTARPSEETSAVVVTAGADGEVRVYVDADDVDPRSVLVGDEVLAMTTAPAAISGGGGVKFYAAAASTHTVSCYDIPSGTGGQDCGVVVCRLASDVTALATSGDGILLAVGTDDGSVAIIHTNTMQRIGEATPTSDVDGGSDGHKAPVLAIAFDDSCNFMASSSCDGCYVVWDVSALAHTTRGKKDDHSSELVGTTTMQGSVTLKRMSTRPAVFKTSADVRVLSSPRARMCWLPAMSAAAAADIAALLALPIGGAVDIVHVALDMATDDAAMHSLKLQEQIGSGSSNRTEEAERVEVASCVRIDGNRVLLVAGTSAGRLAGFVLCISVDNRDGGSGIISSQPCFTLSTGSTSSSPVHGLALRWSASRSTDEQHVDLALIDARGYWAAGIINILPVTPCRSDVAATDTTTDEIEIGAFVERSSNSADGCVTGDDDEERLAQTMFGVSDDSDENADSGAFNLRKIKNASMAGFTDDVEVNLTRDDAKKVHIRLAEVKSAANCDGVSVRDIRREIEAAQPAIQPPFQSGSDPIRSFGTTSKRLSVSSTGAEGLSCRLLMWNAVGVVRKFGDRGGESEHDLGGSIEVQFHDASVYHPLHLPASVCWRGVIRPYALADVSGTCVALATESTDDDEVGDGIDHENTGRCNASVLTVYVLIGGGGTLSAFRASDSIPATNMWSLTMSDAEEIVALSAATRVVATATDLRMVRLFSIGGLQLTVVSMHGPVLTVAASPKMMNSTNDTMRDGNDVAVAVHGGGMPLPYNQCVSLTTLTVDGRYECRVNNDFIPLALTPNAELHWLGFADDGSNSGGAVVATLDSAGWLRISPITAVLWTPVLLMSQAVAATDAGKRCDDSEADAARRKRHVARCKADRYLVVDVSLPASHVQALRVGAASASQMVAQPLPVPQLLPFTMALCDGSKSISSVGGVSDTSNLESEIAARRLIAAGGALYRSRQHSDAVDEARDDANALLLKLFASACKTHATRLAQRIYDVFALITDTDVRQAALRYSVKARLTGHILAQLNAVALRMDAADGVAAAAAVDYECHFEEEEIGELISRRERHRISTRHPNNQPIVSERRDPGNVSVSQMTTSTIADDMFDDVDSHDKSSDRVATRGKENGAPLNNLMLSRASNPFKFKKTRSDVITLDATNAVRPPTANDGNLCFDAVDGVAPRHRHSSQEMKQETERVAKRPRMTLKRCDSEAADALVAAKPLKGFQLWRAENQASSTGSNVTACVGIKEEMATWQALPSSVRDQYRVARMPVVP